MASTRHELFVTQKEVERASRIQDLREPPRRAMLERAQENDALKTEKPTGGAEAHGEHNGSSHDASFSEDALFDPTTRKLSTAPGAR